MNFPLESLRHTRTQTFQLFAPSRWKINILTNIHFSSSNKTITAIRISLICLRMALCIFKQKTNWNKLSQVLLSFSTQILNFSYVFHALVFTKVSNLYFFAICIQKSFPALESIIHSSL